MSETDIGQGQAPDDGRGDRWQILRALPSGFQIYMAMSFWTLLAWPMTFAHIFDNFGWSPNAGNLAGLAFGGGVEAVLIASAGGIASAWEAEARYRAFVMPIFCVNIAVVFLRTIIQHIH